MYVCNVCMHVCMFVCLHVCTNSISKNTSCIYVCMFVRMYVYVSVTPLFACKLLNMQSVTGSNWFKMDLHTYMYVCIYPSSYHQPVQTGARTYMGDRGTINGDGAPHSPSSFPVTDICIIPLIEFLSEKKVLILIFAFWRDFDRLFCRLSVRIKSVITVSL